MGSPFKFFERNRCLSYLLLCQNCNFISDEGFFLKSNEQLLHLALVPELISSLCPLAFYKQDAVFKGVCHLCCFVFIS
jgi:hypothetical protein